MLLLDIALDNWFRTQVTRIQLRRWSVVDSEGDGQGLGGYKYHRSRLCCCMLSHATASGKQRILQALRRLPHRLTVAVCPMVHSCPQQVERVEKSSLSGDSLVDLVHVVLQNAVIAGESEELGQVPVSLCVTATATLFFTSTPACLDAYISAVPGL